jgi:superfamily II DNA/RNA helicase
MNKETKFAKERSLSIKIIAVIGGMEMKDQKQQKIRSN